MTELNRDLMLCSDIDNDSVKTVIESIIAINKEDKKKLKELKDYKAEPIKLYINTYGGYNLDGLALIGIMEASITPIHTIALGKVMSMGLPIFTSGDVRITTKYTTFMYHDAAYGGNRSLEGQKEMLKQAERDMNIYNEILFNTTKMPKAKMDEIRRTKSEWYINSKEAIELGIADKVLEKEGVQM